MYMIWTWMGTHWFLLMLTRYHKDQIYLSARQKLYHFIEAHQVFNGGSHNTYIYIEYKFVCVYKMFILKAQYFTCCHILTDIFVFFDFLNISKVL